MVREIEIIKTPGKSLGKISASESWTVRDIKSEISRNFNIQVQRQSIRSGPKGKDESNSTQLKNLSLDSPNTIYVKDLGPQIGWDTVFFLEYLGPILLYAMLFLYPSCFYSQKSLHDSHGYSTRDVLPFRIFPINQINEMCGGNSKVQTNAYIAGVLWTVHYGKRILETAFVHRFSHGTMPIFNLFKNCSYYWGFALYVAYHVNHPLHTPPSPVIFFAGVVIFVVCELGNLSIHLLLRDLRPEGTTERKIPLANANPLTKLFDLVSCPNYTYEYGAWVGFTLLTGCLPVFIFALAGLAQMTIWAVAKHKKYRSEFPNYPKSRKAILPFLI